MASSKNYSEVGLNNDKNQNISNSSPSSDFDRLEDCHEAEFRGATLSLSREPSPESAAASALDDPNGNVDTSTEAKRRASSIRLNRSSNVQDFFAVREGALQKAAEQCRPVLLDQLDGDLRGIWLLTDCQTCEQHVDCQVMPICRTYEEVVNIVIDHWDTEKERLLFLTEKSLISLKYDFITLKLLDYHRYELKQFQQIVIGELKYPEKSLMPKINGAMDFLKQRIIPKLRQGRNFRQPVDQNSTKLTVVANRPRSAVARNQLGIQCSWSSAEQIPALKRWNPWSRDIPWVTYTSHPLYKMDTAEKTNYDIEDFSKTLINTISAGSEPSSPVATPSTPNCKVIYQPIVIESYAGLAAALHNVNELGFFKSRGKVSF